MPRKRKAHLSEPMGQWDKDPDLMAEKPSTGGFIMIDKKYLARLVGDSSTMLVYLCLVHHAKPDGFCYPGHKAICDFCGLTQPTVRRAIAKLQQVDLLKLQYVDGKGYRYWVTFHDSTTRKDREKISRGGRKNKSPNKEPYNKDKAVPSIPPLDLISSRLWNPTTTRN